MKRLVHLILLSVITLLTVSSCAGKYSQIRFTSFSIKSFVPDGRRAADILAAVGVDNPAKDFVVEQLNCTVKVSGNVIGTLKASGIRVESGSGKVYELPLRGELSEGVSWLSMLGALRTLEQDAVKVDISAKIKLHGGFGKTIEYKDVPLDKLTGLF